MIYLNNTPLHVTMFPDNTSQVWNITSLKNNTIIWQFENEAEFLHLAQLKSLLDTMESISTLTISYLPYGRQDKEISNNTTFALHVFAELLNSLNFHRIVIHDPHSRKCLDLIQNSEAKYPIDEVMKVAFNTKTDLFCYPDKGAYIKYTGGGDFQQEVYDYPYIYGNKVRDQLTGSILSYEIISNGMEITNFHGKNILIVDDICDGGATFTVLAKKLRLCGVGDINLFVTHGLFTKGLKVLKNAGIKRIFTEKGEADEYEKYNNPFYKIIYKEA